MDIGLLKMIKRIFVFLDCYFHGKEKHARNHFNDLKSIDFSPENWFIAYKNNNIIGLVIPQKFNNEVGSINYIGVIPDERGHMI